MSLENEQKYLNFQKYELIINDSKNLNREKLKEIFSPKIDSFFSENFATINNWFEEWKKNQETEIKEKNWNFVVKWLNDIEFEFGISSDSNESIKKIKLDINFSKELIFKEEVYLELILKKLKQEWFDFSLYDSHLWQPDIITWNFNCEGWICDFLNWLKCNFDEKNKNNDKYEEILEFILENNFLWLSKKLKFVKDNDKKLYEKIEELGKMKKELTWENKTKELQKQYDKNKLDIIYDIFSKSYTILIADIDKYLNFLDTKIFSENIEETKEKVEEILETEKKLELTKEDEQIYKAVENILTEQKKVLKKQLNWVIENLKDENKKKETIKKYIEIGQEIPVLIKNIEKNISLEKTVKNYLSKFFNIIKTNFKKSKEENNSEKENKKNIIKKSILEFFDSGEVNSDKYPTLKYENNLENIDFDIFCLLYEKNIRYIKYNEKIKWITTHFDFLYNIENTKIPFLKKVEYWNNDNKTKKWILNTKNWLVLWKKSWKEISDRIKEKKLYKDKTKNKNIASTQFFITDIYKEKVNFEWKLFHKIKWQVDIEYHSYENTEPKKIEKDFYINFETDEILKVNNFPVEEIFEDDYFERLGKKYVKVRNSEDQIFYINENKEIYEIKNNDSFTREEIKEYRQKRFESRPNINDPDLEKYNEKTNKNLELLKEYYIENIGKKIDIWWEKYNEIDIIYKENYNNYNNNIKNTKLKAFINLETQKIYTIKDKILVYLDEKKVTFAWKNYYEIWLKWERKRFYYDFLKNKKAETNYWIIKNFYEENSVNWKKYREVKIEKLYGKIFIDEKFDIYYYTFEWKKHLVTWITENKNTYTLKVLSDSENIFSKELTVDIEKDK